MKKMHLLLLTTLSLVFFLTGCFEEEKEKKDTITLTIGEQVALIGEAFTAIDLTTGNYLSGIEVSDITDLNVPPSANFTVTVEGSKLQIAPVKADFYGKDTLTIYLTYGEGTTLSFPLPVAVHTPPVIGDIYVAPIKPGGQFQPISLPDYVTDLDGDSASIFWSVSSPNGNVTASIDANTNVATISIIDATLVGTSTLTFAAKDSDGHFDTLTVVFEISDGTQPIAPVITPAIPNQSIEKGGTFTPVTLANHVIDADGGATPLINWSCSEAVNFTAGIFNGVFGVVLTNPAWVGSESVTLIATDVDGLSDTAVVTFTVTDNGTEKIAPVITPAIPNQVIKQGEGFSSITLSDHVIDADGDASLVVWTNSYPANITAGIDDGIFEAIVQSTDWIGTESVTFIVTDADGLSDTAVVTFTVTDSSIEKLPPVITPAIPNQSVEKGGTFTPVTLSNHVIDADGGATPVINWTCSEAVNFTAGIFNGMFGAVLTNPDWVGSESVTLIATDVDGLSDTAVVTFTVTDNGTEKLPPIISEIPNQSIEKGQNFAAVNLQEYVTDPDGDKNLITWNATGDSNITLTLVNKVMTVVPNIEWVGTAMVTLVATDSDGLKDSAVVKYKVTGGGIVIPANDWVFDKNQVITTIENTTPMMQIPPSVDTVEQVATDTTEILSTTDDSITVYAKQENITTKAVFGNNLKIGEGLLAGLSEEEMKDSLNANSDIIAEQLKETISQQVAVDSVDIVFDDVTFGEPSLTEEATALFVAYEVVITASITAYANIGVPVQLPIKSVTTVSNLSTYKEYEGTIPPANWPQTIVDAQ